MQCAAYNATCCAVCTIQCNMVCCVGESGAPPILPITFPEMTASINPYSDDVVHDDQSYGEYDGDEDQEDGDDRDHRPLMFKSTSSISPNYD